MSTAECLAHSKCSVRLTSLWEPYMEVLMDQAPLPWLMFEVIQIIKTIKKAHSVSTVRGVAWHFLNWLWGWGQRQSKNPKTDCMMSEGFCSSDTMRCWWCCLWSLLRRAWNNSDSKRESWGWSENCVLLAKRKKVVSVVRPSWAKRFPFGFHKHYLL